MDSSSTAIPPRAARDADGSTTGTLGRDAYPKLSALKQQFIIKLTVYLNIYQGDMVQL